ncbi:protein Hook homolog 3-like [Salarias fasciatus]|uniref:protein Hook homolog 3-like n=1 Tax=Salarias fasciatus TaxID=181472 RepID=UPI001176595B|nr:protein Hook homolog 3-like [Salarias fasciatus]
MSSEEKAGVFDASEVKDCLRDRGASRQEQEEKLVLTAWENTLDLCEDSRAAGPPQSFLARQRQSTQARRALCRRRLPR